jgi:putative membrane protein
MWRYGHFPYFSWMGGFFPGGIFSILIWGLIILALIYVAVKLFGAIRSGQSLQNTDRNHSLNILKIRYATGEIGHEDYLTMKETLKQSG